MCSGFVLEPFGHRQGRRGKASTMSVDRVVAALELMEVLTELWPYTPAGTGSGGGPLVVVQLERLW